MNNREKKSGRVLFINEHSLNHNNATAITMRSLWEDWPKSDIFELYYVEYASNQFSLNHSVLLERGVIGKLRRSEIGEEICVGSKQRAFGKDHWTQRVISDLREAAVSYVLSKKGRVCKKTLQEIDDFDPEVIYTLGGGVGVLKCAYRMSKRYDIPMIIHFMDNWVEHSQNDVNIFTRPYRYSLKKWLTKSMGRAKAAITISESMADAYSLIFPSFNFIPLMNSVDVQTLWCEPRERTDRRFVFSYAGGMHLDRWKGLLEIGRAIKETGIDAVLNIYTSSDTKRFLSFFSDLPVRFYPPVSHEQIQTVYRESDCLVHVETNDPVMEGYFKYSISTKIPEYLASGRVMFFYGPKTLGLYRYLETNHAAYLADDYDALCKQLVNISAFEDGPAILSNAYTLAKTKHDAVRARETLKETVQACING